MPLKQRRAQLNKQGLTLSKGVNETIENLLQSAHLLKKGRGQGEVSTNLQIEPIPNPCHDSVTTFGGGGKTSLA